jgi:seryl-tRNA(Sec) selenium transferase
MKNGNLIDVDQMSETHLRNTLKMIVRNTQVKLPITKTRIGNIESNFMEEQFLEYAEEENFNNY